MKQNSYQLKLDIPEGESFLLNFVGKKTFLPLSTVNSVAMYYMKNSSQRTHFQTK